MRWNDNDDMCRDVPGGNDEIEAERLGWGKEERLGCKGAEIWFCWEKLLNADIKALFLDDLTNFEVERQSWGEESRLGSNWAKIGFCWEKWSDADMAALFWDDLTGCEAERQGWG